MKEPVSSCRPIGQRYRLSQDSCHYWEVGWDQPQGSFYAQHFQQPPGEPLRNLLAWIGLRFTEVATVDRLEALMNRSLPSTVRRALVCDQITMPYRGPPELAHALAAIRHPTAGGTPRPDQLLMATGYERSGVVLCDQATDMTTFYPQAVWGASRRAPTDHRLTLFAAFEQVTAPAIYPQTRHPDASPCRGVDHHLATVATLRCIESDGRQPGEPISRFELVRTSALSDDGTHGGVDRWLSWHTTTQTWELADDPCQATIRHPRLRVPILQPGPYPAPESWSLHHEIGAIDPYDEAPQVDQVAPTPTERAPFGIYLGTLD